MGLKRNILEIILVIIVIILAVFFGRTYFFDNKNDNVKSTEFASPEIKDKEIGNSFKVKLEFSDPSVFDHIMLSSKITTKKGEVDLGNFVVRDIRLWRVDGERIIDDTFSVDNQPLYIIINQKSGSQEKVIFEGELENKTELQTKNDEFNSTLTVTVSSN